MIGKFFTKSRSQKIIDPCKERECGSRMLNSVGLNFRITWLMPYRSLTWNPELEPKLFNLSDPPVWSKFYCNENKLFFLRILFGGNHLYVFANPKKKGVKTNQEITYDMAQKEIVKHVGLGGGIDGSRSKGANFEKIDLKNL